jgi:hypothetical protein
MPDITSSLSGMRYGDFWITGTYPQGHPIMGTSFAAPAVLGIALLTHQYEGLFSQLAYPPVNKAVLVAGTRDSNSDGQIGQSTSWSSTPEARDGAGHIDLARVKQVLDNNTYVKRDLLDSDLVSCGAGCREWIAGSATVPAGGGLRAALVWQSCTTGSTAGTATSPVLNNDLDLVIRAVCNKTTSTTTTSDTITSELEMVHVNDSVCSPCTSCTASIRVRIKNGATLQSCGSTAFERIGVAWTSGTGTEWTAP